MTILLLTTIDGSRNPIGTYLLLLDDTTGNAIYSVSGRRSLTKYAGRSAILCACCCLLFSRNCRHPSNLLMIIFERFATAMLWPLNQRQYLILLLIKSSLLSYLRMYCTASGVSASNSFFSDSDNIKKPPSLASLPEIISLHWQRGRTRLSI